MKMLPELDKMADAVLAQPGFTEAVYPKRIAPPLGYTNPRYYSLSAAGGLMMWRDRDLDMLPHISLVTQIHELVRYGFPVYFVDNDFAQAVVNTKPPENFTFADIVMPLPAMTFVLPDEFINGYFGHPVPFVSTVMVPKGVYPNLNSLKFYAARDIDNQVDRIGIHFPYYSKHGFGADYTGSYPLTMPVADMMKCNYVDASEFECRRRLIPNFEDGTPKGEDETKLRETVYTFAVKLLLALTAAPNYIVNGAQTRKERVKHGKKIDALWTPNFIGRNYKQERSYECQGGTHASPRMHWRIGHMHTYLIGPGRQQKTLKWIKPVLVSTK